MFLPAAFNLGVVASPTITSVFDISLTFPTIQVFDNESDFRDETDATDYTIVHAKDTDKLYVYDGTVWRVYNQN